MNKKQALALYKKYHEDCDNQRLGLFAALDKKYEVNRVLYPGCFVHITPSLIFPNVVYVDSDRRAEQFFNDNAVHSFVNNNRLYEQGPSVSFHKSDYTKDFGENTDQFDLLLSQYAGFVSQACKKYLKKDGMLVANNSHGDAGMASIDPDYQLIAVYKRRNDTEYSISEKNLDSYFIPKSQRHISKAYLEKTQRGIGYTKNASGYIFKKTSNNAE